MIYFDNAATGGFKPYSVQEVVPTVIKHLCANPTRSGHKLAATGGSAVYKTRKLCLDMFGGYSEDRVIFTKNCTESLNTAILGTLKSGDHVITTCMEHNSVLRPLEHLKKLGVQVTVIYPQKNAYITQKYAICYDDIKPHIQGNTRLIITNHASNVTGALTDIHGIGNKLKREFPNILYLVDGAQSGGHIPINMKDSGIDILCLACHKGLGGIMGSGLLIFGECDISPLNFGGTGSDSFNLSQPDYYPDRLESGTLNLPAIVALSEGLLHLDSTLEFIGGELKKMTEKLISILHKVPDIAVYSRLNPCGIVAFSLPQIPSQLAAQTLSDKYDIAVRGGFHCAPLMHKYLGTDADGLIRVSLCEHNTYREISLFERAIKDMLSSPTFPKDNL